MYALNAGAEDMLLAAVEVAQRGGLLAALDALAAPIYVTDAEGVVTYFNPACVGFTGRTPAAGKDRWCVTWKLYTDEGEFLPHDQCPMAVAVRERRPIRGLTAVAERPDGARVSFMPFPTPLFDADGAFLGAVNMLIDVTELRQIAELREQAKRCRRLAEQVPDKRAGDDLRQMAIEFDTKAAELAQVSALRPAQT